MFVEGNLLVKQKKLRNEPWERNKSCMERTRKRCKGWWKLSKE